MATIILVHGFLGFGGVPGDFISYFRGIKQRYEAGNIHQVYCPNLGALGLVADRAATLASFIRKEVPASAAPLHLIAHSRGGLDSRLMLAMNPDIAGRTHRLVTVATPHFGTPVATHVLDLLRVPPILNPLGPLAPDLLKSLQELTPVGVTLAPKVTPVSYVSIACDAANVVLSPLPFGATQRLGAFGNLPNDGLVGLDSALCDPAATTPRSGCWPVDHAAAVGWPTDPASVFHPTRFQAEHIARYEALLVTLLA